jgi:hypothetical protein
MKWVVHVPRDHLEDADVDVSNIKVDLRDNVGGGRGLDSFVTG